jgi:cyclophilin family peptidyl-prolyl cis-trans isomerase
MTLLCALALAVVAASSAMAEGAAPAPPASTLAAGPQVLIKTSLGNVTVALDPAHAPLTVQNFLRYVKEGHFDGAVFYRVVPGFVIQAGSYDADIHYRSVHDDIPLEANTGLKNLRGTIAMARQEDPNTANAEFFINLADNADLDHHSDDPGNATGYAVFGHVVNGMDVVDKIAAVPLGDHGPVPGAAPVDPVVIQSVSVVQ